MNKKTKVTLIILIIALIIVVAIAAIALVNPFKDESASSEALNDMQINGIENTQENTIKNDEQENNLVNEETNSIKETEETNQEKPSTSDNANNSNEEKAIELVKKEWGEDNTVYFDLAGVTSDGKYRVSVNRDTKVLAWYIVDIENETVTQK